MAQEQADPRPAYPFFTFLTVTSDHEQLADYPDHRTYQVVLQLDSRSNDYWQADELAEKLSEALHDHGYKRFLKQCHMTMQKTSDVISHNAILGSNYEYSQGFDATFEIAAGFEFDETNLDFTYRAGDTIESAAITTNDGTTITTKK